VGVVEKSKMQRSDSVQEGDILLGLRSTGLHTNGYSLARKVLFPRFSTEQYFDDLGMTLGEALLAVHKSYLPVMKPILAHTHASNLVHGMSHITGGGIVGNTNRVVPKNLRLDVDWSAWQLPPLFALIQREGKISDEEMRHVFNLGIGYIIITPESSVDEVSAMLPEKPVVMGNVVLKT
jgi:phosphoribosylformylglycinamidine cyclo-ligase